MQQYLESTYLACRLRMSAAYVDNLRRVFAALDAFSGGGITPADMTERLVSLYLASRADLAAATVNNHRRMILSVWMAAADDGLCEPPRPRKVQRLREPAPRPEAWTVGEIAELLKTARRWPGMVGGIVAAGWWSSLIGTLYYTGSRIGGLLDVPPAAYRAGAGLFVTEPKTGKTTWHPLPTECCELIDAIWWDGRQRIWPWPHTQRHLFRQFRRIVAAAGIRNISGSRQLFHRLRRTTLSYCAASDPALAQKIAGHSDYRTTQRYLDPAIVGGGAAMNAVPVLF